VSSAFYPTEGLSQPLSAAFYVNPLTYIVDITRAGIFAQVSMFTNIEVVILGLLSAAVFLIATRSMIKMEAWI
ncbi:MAG: ABC transporter permease, partial [Nitrososphaeraceae archaeon]